MIRFRDARADVNHVDPEHATPLRQEQENRPSTLSPWTNPPDHYNYRSQKPIPYIASGDAFTLPKAR